MPAGETEASIEGKRQDWSWVSSAAKGEITHNGKGQNQQCLEPPQWKLTRGLKLSLRGAAVGSTEENSPQLPQKVSNAETSLHPFSPSKTVVDWERTLSPPPSEECHQKNHNFPGTSPDFGIPQQLTLEGRIPPQN
ncbi:hypothetical protein NE237_031423 [Protea cynaroides]|uniref:Uncharacterized protein n=1 Tax=Protea cynaroides TaxID=273540 RepID=A0A9Q0L2F1_9MAGN|nr:hypothetical protein NE237_031423 [Protea cynaroides]